MALNVAWSCRPVGGMLGMVGKWGRVCGAGMSGLSGHQTDKGVRRGGGGGGRGDV